MTERTIFLSALEIDDPDARREYLDRACRGVPAVRPRVDALLEAHFKTRSFLDRPAVDQAMDLSGGPPDGPDTPTPSQTGLLLADRYLLGEEIGRGGMGTVYRAEQLRPVKRPVAVKLVNPGMDSRPVLARFDAERQALALMDHPHIAKVLDAGATPGGRPFFVMELVDGVPITEFCDARKLTPTDRLGLFRQVCAAVQHAHQKGIIHRDIKPGNVLVEDRAGVAVPKVIDFGLAKAVGGASITDQTFVTLPGMVAGTPMYMAPEQSGPEAMDIDTRADVYALGAVLYELLAGSPPIRRETLRRAALHELFRMIREEQPPPPSGRIGSSLDLAVVAINRGVEPARLGRFVRGDLDWVVMKALEKDRGRRYESAASLGVDIERFLHHEPVTAGPPTLRYRGAKFVRRNRAAVTAATVVLATLVAGVFGTSWGLVEARTQRDAAEAARSAEARRAEAERLARESEAVQRRAAVEEAGNAVAVRNFLIDDLLLQSSPAFQSGFSRPDREIKVRTLLDRAAARLPGALGDRPLLEGSIRSSVGQAYLQLGEYEPARAQLAAAAGLLTRARGPGHADTLRAATGLAATDAERGEFAAAEARLIALLGTARATPDLPPEVLAELLLNLVKLEGFRQRPADAEPHLAEIGGIVARLGDDHPLAVEYDLQRAGILFLQGRHVDSEALAKAGLVRCRRILGDSHPMAAIFLGQVALCLNRQGRHLEAAAEWRALADLAANVLGPEHPDTLNRRFNLGRALQDGASYDEAIRNYRELVAVYERLKGNDDPQTIGTLGYLAETLRAAGRFAEAEPLYERARLNFHARSPAGALPEALQASGRAACLIRLGRPADAEPLLRDALAFIETTEPRGWRAALLRSRLGAALLARRDHAQAEPLLIAGYNGLRDRRPAAPLSTLTPDDRAALADTADRLVELAEATGRPDDATRWRAERAKYPPSPIARTP